MYYSKMLQQDSDITSFVSNIFTVNLALCCSLPVLYACLNTLCIPGKTRDGVIRKSVIGLSIGTIATRMVLINSC